MKCPVCGAQNDEGTAYCYQCGSALRQGNAEPATGRTVMLGSDTWNERAEAPTPSPSSAHDSNVYGSAPTQRPHDARTYDVPPQPTLQTSIPPASVLQTSIPPTPALPTVQTPYLVTNVQLSGTTTSTLAVFSLVLGILSWTFLPFIAAIGAIITGHMARREIASASGRLSGDGLVLAGLIMGYANLVLSVGGCAVFAIFIAAS